MAQQLPETEGYSASKGLFSARKAIMQYAQLKNIPNVTIDLRASGIIGGDYNKGYATADGLVMDLQT